MLKSNIHISDDFAEVSTKSVDERQRVSLGDELKGFKRVQLFKNRSGEILIRPLVEVPASEAWLYKNKKASTSVKKGLEEAAAGKVSKLNLKDL